MKFEMKKKNNNVHETRDGLLKSFVYVDYTFLRRNKLKKKKLKQVLQVLKH